MLLSVAIPTYVLYLASIGRAPTTIAYYRGCLERFQAATGDTEVAKITHAHLVHFLADLNYQGKSQATLQAYWKTFKSFFTWCQDELKLVTRPDEKIKCPQVPQPEVMPFSHDDIRALLRAAAFTDPAITRGRKSFRMKRATAARDLAMVLLLLDTGLRVSEMGRLKIADVDLFESGSVQVHAYRSGKKSRPRTVYISKRTAYQVHLYINERGKPHPTESLFLSINHRPMDKDSIEGVIANLGKRARVPKTHPHRFRHTFAIEFLRNGGDVFTLQRMLGHNSLDMVKRYLSISSADIENAHRLASPVDNWRL
jgi:integrase/recombinase XerD